MMEVRHHPTPPDPHSVFHVQAIRHSVAAARRPGQRQAAQGLVRGPTSRPTSRPSTDDEYEEKSEDGGTDSSPACAWTFVTTDDEDSEDFAWLEEDEPVLRCYTV